MRQLLPRQQFVFNRSFSGFYKLTFFPDPIENFHLFSYFSSLAVQPTNLVPTVRTCARFQVCTSNVLQNYHSQKLSTKKLTKLWLWYFSVHLERTRALSRKSSVPSKRSAIFHFPTLFSLHWPGFCSKSGRPKLIDSLQQQSFYD